VVNVIAAYQPVVRVCCVAGTIAKHELWTLQLSPLVRTEEGIEKEVETSKF
jgi:hypothetical protein